MSKSKWQVALENAASSRKRNQNGTVLLLGNPSCGKSTLIRGLQRYAAGGADRLRQDEAYFNTGGAPIVDAAALPVRASTDVSGDFTYQTCALLVLQSAKWSDIAGIILRRRWMQCGMKGTTLLIVVGLSDMIEAYEEADAWLKFASKFVPEQVAKTEEESSTWEPPLKDSFMEVYADLREQSKRTLATRRQEIEKHTQSRMSMSDKQQSTISLTARELESDVINLGFQTLVCCCKADMLPSVRSMSNTDMLNEELIFTVYMRELCRQYGATLLFLNAEDDDNSNLARLNTLITSPITKENVLLPPTISSGLSLYVPAGWDTKEELQQMANTCNVPHLSIPLQTLVKRRYDGTDITSNLEEKNRDSKVPVPPPFDQFLKSLATSGDGEFVAPSEAFKIVRVLEEDGKKGPDESATTSRAMATPTPGEGPTSAKPQSVSRDSGVVPMSPPSGAPATMEKQGSRKATPDPDPNKSASRVVREKSSMRNIPRDAQDSARKGGPGLVSGLLSDLKKRGDSKRG